MIYVLLQQIQFSMIHKFFEQKFANLNLTCTKKIMFINNMPGNFFVTIFIVGEKVGIIIIKYCLGQDYSSFQGRNIIPRRSFTNNHLLVSEARFKKKLYFISTSVSISTAEVWVLTFTEHWFCAILSEKITSQLNHKL